MRDKTHRLRPRNTCFFKSENVVDIPMPLVRAHILAYCKLARGSDIQCIIIPFGSTSVPFEAFSLLSPRFLREFNPLYKLLQVNFIKVNNAIHNLNYFGKPEHWTLVRIGVEAVQHHVIKKSWYFFMLRQSPSSYHQRNHFLVFYNIAIWFLSARKHLEYNNTKAPHV